MLITLKNNTMSATIDSVGAQLVSLKDSACKEYIWQRNPDFWASSSPLLFPVVGNCRDNKTIFEDTVYDMPKHGFCRGIDFQVTEQNEDSATFEITDNEFTKTMYPYEFSLSLTYTLTGDGISIDYLVKNRDNRTIYYCLGAHPGFNCPLEDGERFEDYQLEFEQKETISAMVYDLKNLQFDREQRIPLLENSNIIPLDYSLFENDALYFDKLDSGKVSIVHPVTRKGVEVDYRDFSSVAFWTPYPKNPSFVCVEPWNGSGICSDEDDDFVHRHDVQTLECGESKGYYLGIRVL